MIDIEGFEGFYALTEDLRVWSFPRQIPNPNSKTHKFNIPGRFLKPLLGATRGKPMYYFFILSNGKMTRHVPLHRLVAKAYIPNPLKKPTVNHKNGVKTDNRIDNLEWATMSENVQHAYDTGLNLPNKGVENGNSKLAEMDVLLIRAMIELGEMKSEIAVWFDIERYYVHRIKNRVNWAHI